MNNLETNTKKFSNRYPLTLRNRNIVRYDVTHNGLKLSLKDKSATAGRALNLSDLSDILEKIDKSQDPKDLHLQGNRLKVVVDNGRAYGQVLTGKGISEKLPFTKTGLQSLLRQVPGVDFRYLTNNWATDELGDKISTMLYAHCSLGLDKTLLVRTINRGANERVIRSVHPTGHNGCYQPFSHVDLVKSFLEGAPEYADAPVLSFILTDDGVRIRMASPSLEDDILKHQSIDRIEVNKPINVLNLRNSETGTGGLGGDGGIWTLVCSNGMTSYQGEMSQRTPHRGRPDRLAGWYSGFVQDILTKQYGMLEKYNEALHLYVDDLYEFTRYTFEEAAKSGRHKPATSKDIIEQVISVGLKHSTTEPTHAVTQVSQAIALIAQQQDFKNEILLEEIAMDTLSRGLGLAESGRVVVPRR